MLIKLRVDREEDILNNGESNSIFSDILQQLELENYVTANDVCKKWLQLAQTYFRISVQLLEEDNQSEKSTTWPFYHLMHKAMEKIKINSPEGLFKGLKTRKSPEFTWVTEITKKFIKLRGEKHSEIAAKGHNSVYQEILNKLNISDKVSIIMARKKWNYLVNRYQDEVAAGGVRSWAFFNDMAHVMKHFKGCTEKLKSRASPEFLWPNDLTRKFIQLRVEKHDDFADHGIQTTYTEIMEQLEIGHILNPNQLRKKWNYLVSKYKELTNTSGPDGTSPAPHSWPFYQDVHDALQKLPKNTHGSKVGRINSLENICKSYLYICIFFTSLLFCFS